MNSAANLKIAIYSPVMPGTAGGIAQFIAGLVHALGQLSDGSETYSIIVSSQQQLDWLEPFAGANQGFVLKTSDRENTYVKVANGRVTFPYLVKRVLGPLVPAARSLQKLISPARYWPEVPLSDGFYESLGCDVIHFPMQGFVLCAMPSVYNPHDLQHLHFPQFFRPGEIAERETIYSAGCRFAHTVAVGSHWAKQDVVRQYRISPEKIQVIPEGAPTQFCADPSQDFLSEVKSKYQVKQPFALYPAVTWPHKNHIRLMEALAYLRDIRGLKIRLVCTGSRHDEFWPYLERRINDLTLQSQVQFLGFVPEEDLRALYRLSQFLVEPSLFEASSLPIFEAWFEGVPVVCSDRTALPEQVLDAALLFNPESKENIAAALEKMVTNSDLRRELRQSGFRRLKDFDWTRTAKAYRAIYRRAAGRTLTEEDRWLLTSDWMRNPERPEEMRK
jgi:glycosyltransferase involved in cell wall biosynthesis